MGAEGSDPLSQCCCAKPYNYEIDEGRTINQPFTANERLMEGKDKIIRLQAIVKSVQTRLKYIKRRDQVRKRSTHFFVTD